jgi:hypothetical protein
VQKFVLPVPHPRNTSVITIGVPQGQLKEFWNVTLFDGWFSGTPKHCEGVAITEPGVPPVKFFMLAYITTPTRGVFVVSSRVR